MLNLPHRPLLAAASLISTACAPTASPPPREQSAVDVARANPDPSSDPAPSAPRATARVLLTNSLPLLRQECSPRLAGFTRTDTVPPPEIRECLEDQDTYLPLACWVADRWLVGQPCLNHLPPTWRSKPRLTVRCRVDGAGSDWTRDVALRIRRADPILVASDSPEPSLRPIPPPVQGEGLDVDQATQQAIVAATERDLGRPVTMFLVTQSLEANLTGDPEPERLLNVRLVGLPHPTRGGMTERHVLYLFADSAPPVALRMTTGEHAAQGFEIVATTDLDRDGRQELVLHTHNWIAPVETLFAKIDGTTLTRIGAWSCENRGLVPTR